MSNHYILKQQPMNVQNMTGLLNIINIEDNYPETKDLEIFYQKESKCPTPVGLPGVFKKSCV
ncbi:MAG: hypothetical protein HQK53_19255 [Oligoflexia bacterium]|nr:hypothetical protein [Oligoflexia bacterium]